MDAVKVLESHFGSDFYKLKKSDDLQYILSAMEEYSNLKARDAAIAFLDSIRNYEHEAGKQICYDERSSEELYTIYITTTHYHNHLKNNTNEPTTTPS